ncbi:MAG: hypothetical protein ACE5F9_03990 [Phycisphaerae bacterium]
MTAVRWAWRTWAVVAAACVAGGGCGGGIAWPDGPVSSEGAADGTTTKAFAVGGSSRPNYYQRLVKGRVRELSFDDDADGVVDERVELAPNGPDAAHCVIILDGVPFDLVRAMCDEGHFQLFGPPVRVVSVFPAMTDMALSRIVRSERCVAAESLYFDRDRNALSNGNQVYMSGQNAPWRSRVQYAAPQRVAINTYLFPASVWATELRGMHALFDRTKTGMAIGYSVGTAGLGTRGGEEAIRRYLIDVEKLCERITYDRRGRVRFTILADHGHSLQRCERVSFRKALTDAGFRMTQTLQAPNDVVTINYGLVTCALFHTNRAAEVAATLVKHPAVDLVTYADDDDVVVRNADGQAAIRQRPGGFAYDASRGDPLALAPVLAQLRATGHVDDDGTIEDRPLFDATVTHRYPDPLHRLWDCFHALVDKPADVIVSLRPEACHGSRFFHFFVAPVASTHGGLDYSSSVTFLLTNAARKPLPPAIRVDDVYDLLRVEPPADNPAN